MPLWDFVVVVSIYAIGFQGMVDPQAIPEPQPNNSALIACNVLAACSLVSVIWWIILMRGHRVFAICVSAVQLSLLLFAVFVNRMALTGKWI